MTRLKTNSSYPRFSILRRLPLSKQLQYGVIAISLLCVILTSYFLGMLFWSSYTSLLMDNQLSKMNLHANELTFWMSNHLDALRNASKLGWGQDATDDMMEEVYGLLMSKYFAIHSISLFHNDQSEAFSVSRDSAGGLDPILESSVFTKTVNSKADYIGKVFYYNDVPMLNIYIPVIDVNGEVVRVAYAVIDLSYMAVNIKSISLEQYGYAYVIDEKNSILASNFASATIQPQAHMSKDYFYFLNNSSPKYYRGIDKKIMISSFRVVKAAQWYLVIEYPLTSLLKNLWKNIALMLIALGSAILIGIISVRAIYNNISFPLNELVNAADKIKNGDLDIRLNSENSNELGNLGDAFNSVTEKLSMSLSEIQHQMAYEKLTAELSSMYITMETTDFAILHANACNLIGEFTNASSIAQYELEPDSGDFVLINQWKSKDRAKMIAEIPDIIAKDRCPSLFEIFCKKDVFVLTPEEVRKFTTNDLHATHIQKYPKIVDGNILENLVQSADMYIIGTPFMDKDQLCGFQMFLFDSGQMSLNESRMLKIRNLSALIGTSTLKIKKGIKLDETTEKLSLTLNSIGDAVLTVGKDERIKIANPVASSILGITNTEMAGLPLNEVLHLVTVSGDSICCGSVLDNLQHNCKKNTLYIKTKQNSIVPIDICVSKLYDNNRNDRGNVIVFRDISERLQIESERMKMERQEALGYLAAGMAHDFNNLLSTVMSSIGLAKLSVADNPKASKRLSDTEKYIMQGKAIAEQLYMLDKNADRVEGNSMLQTTLKQVTHMALYKSGIEEDYDLQEDLPPVKLADGIVNQIIANLVINAAQAMTNGGKLLVRARTIDIANNTEMPLTPGKYVKVNIIDNGPGMDADTLNKVFLPYFTTKDKGTGLGIPMVLALITRYKGYFKISSVPNLGTDAELYFPVA